MAMLSLMIYKVNEQTTIEEFITTNNFLFDTKENMIIANNQAIKLHSKQSAEQPAIINILIKEDNNIIAFHFNGTLPAEPIPQSMLEAYNAIINSLQFKKVALP